MGGQFTRRALLRSGNTTSDIVFLEGRILTAIIAPAVWSTQNVLFNAALDPDITLFNVFDNAGNEVTITSVAASRYVTIKAAKDIAGMRYVQLRVAVAVQADRLVMLAINEM